MNFDSVALVAIDLAKNIFQLHGANEKGGAEFSKRVRRSQMIPFLAKFPSITVVMEACSTSHFWSREIGKLGHEVRLIAPSYVKPFVKRQKNDANDAEAIAEAAMRPTMRFVEPKTEEQQSRTVLFRTRDMLVRQRTQTINALRAHLAEFGQIAPKGVVHIKRLAAVLESAGSEVRPEVVEVGQLLLEQIDLLSKKIEDLEKKLKSEAKQTGRLRRLQTMPGVGPITAVAIESFAPDLSVFRRGRDFAAWLGLVPRQHSTGGKQRLGRTSKMGQRDIRRLFIIGAMSMILAARGERPEADPWLKRMLAKKPKMVVAIALANRMARSLWAMVTKREDYRCSQTAAA